MSFNYFQVNKEDNQKITNFLKKNNINFQMTKVLTDFLYEEDINYHINNYLKNNNTKDENIELIKNYVFNNMEFYNWDNYDDYIVNLIDLYFEQRS